jgi:hypothetical protein
MKNITATYSSKLNRTTFKCSVCRKSWVLKGKESELKAGEKLFLLNHDRSHEK